MWDNLLTIGLFVLIAWAVFTSDGKYRGARTWSGDTPMRKAVAIRARIQIIAAMTIGITTVRIGASNACGPLRLT
jgi:ribosomal protein L4